MINALIQVLTVFSALSINFIIPLVYGLDAYGLFIKSNVIIFAIAKFADAVNEPLMSQCHKKDILVTSLSVYSGIFLVAAILSTFFNLGSLALLVIVFLSASVLLTLFANNLTTVIVQYLLIYFLAFMILLGVERFKLFSLDIIEIVLISTALPSLYGLLKLKGVVNFKLPHLDTVLQTYRQLPQLLSLSLVSNFFFNILPFILANRLTNSELGLLRVNMSIVQSSSSVFPISTRSVLFTFMSEKRVAAFKTLSLFSFLYFSCIMTAATISGILHAPFQPFLALIGIYPMFYWTLLSERYLWSDKGNDRVKVTNILLFSLYFPISFFIQNLNQAYLFYSAGFLIYLFALRVHLPSTEKQYLPPQPIILGLIYSVIASWDQRLLSPYSAIVLTLGVFYFLKHHLKITEVLRQFR